MLLLGAIDIKTGKHASPHFANKSESYKCPDCQRPVILRKGTIRVPHFAHKSSCDLPCNYYDHPNESQIHKAAKERLKDILEAGHSLDVSYLCPKIRADKPWYAKHHPVLDTFKLIENDSVVLEYRAPDGSYIADVAIINSGKPRVIFEIMHTHRTTTVRPEPWYEINASMLLEWSSPNENKVHVQCDRIRSEHCVICQNNDMRTGAIDTGSGGYCLPLEKYRENTCVCLDCKQPVKMLGTIFDHVNETACTMYRFPTKSQKMRDAFYKFTNILQTGIKHVVHTCNFYLQGDDASHCNRDNERYYDIFYEPNVDIIKINFNNSYVSIYSVKNLLKYRFTFVDGNHPVAPIWYKNDKNVLYFYIRLSDYDYTERYAIYVNDICEYCKKIETNLSKAERIDILEDRKDGHFELSHTHQELPCVQCKTNDYWPIFYKGYRRICYDCFANLDEHVLNPTAVSGCQIDD